MGVKKNGMTIMAGSLKTHWMKYVTELNMHINPACSVSINTGNSLLLMLAKINSKFIQPGFLYKHEIVAPKTYNQPSILHLKFVNGTEKQYHMGMSKFHFIEHEIGVINNMIEYERSLAGQDDELDDDD